ncbi:MAG: hypothetical protein Q7T81_01975 [Pseudolabrys sp.]|nr:hypothetical protein [Pseudolabrys sp.]
MKKSLIIGLGVAALIAGTASQVKVDSSKPAPAAIVTAAAADESEAPPVVFRMAQAASPYVFDYERGPRIIQVPQNSRVASRAVVEDDDDVAPPPRHRVVTPKPRVASAPPVERTPRWKPRKEAVKETPAEPAAPPLPRRAVLSAPPLSNGPTPLRPTPRFDNQAADAGIKFAPPPPPVTETQPPLVIRHR